MLVYFLEAKKIGQLKKLKYPLMIMMCGAVSIIVQLFPYSSSPLNTYVHTTYIPHFNINTYWIILTSIQNAFIPIDSQYEELKVALFFAIVLILFIISSIRKTSVFIFLIITYGWIFYVFTTIYSGSLRHKGLILIFIIFSIWISNFYSNIENRFSKELR